MILLFQIILICVMIISSMCVFVDCKTEFGGRMLSMFIASLMAFLVTTYFFIGG